MISLYHTMPRTLTKMPDGSYKFKKTAYKKKKQNPRYTSRGLISANHAIWNTGGVPRQRTANLRLCDRFTLNPGLATADRVFVGLTNIFDPVGGSQKPQGYGAFAALYNHYIVLGAKVSVTFTNTDSSTPVVCGLAITDDQTSSTDWRVLTENGRCVWKVLGNNPDKCKLDINFSTKKFFNLADVKDNKDRLGAVTSQAPSDQAYLEIFQEGVDGLTNPAAQYGVVVIDYLVYFSEPKELIGS